MKKRFALLCALTLLVQLVTVPGLMAGAEDITTPSDLPHVHDGEMSYDDTEHWYACEECGTDAERDVHYAKCTNPTACLVCKAEVVTMSSIWHNFDVRHYSDTECWEVCKDCGSEMNRIRHYGACDDPTTCLRCKQTGVTVDDVQHSYVQKHDALGVLHGMRSKVRRPS